MTVDYGSNDLTTTGDVGINTSSPNFKLDVNGTFSANSVNVNDAFTLPTTDGTEDQALVTNGSGTVAWSTIPVSIKCAIYKDSTGGENFDSTTFTRISNIDEAGSFNDSIFSESGGVYTINETGVYEVNLEFCLVGTAGSNYRYTGEIDMRLGSDTGTLLAKIRDGYIRRNGGANNTSFNLHTIESFTSGDDFRFMMKRINNNSGNATTIGDTCRVMIKQLSTSSGGGGGGGVGV